MTHIFAVFYILYILIMIELISHPITILCLGVIFVLCALLFFYFKRSMMVIEQAQVEQATVLRNFIASMEMKKYEQSYNRIGEIGGTGSLPTNNRVAPSSRLSGDNYGSAPQSLIEVSDDDEDLVSSEDSDSDDEYVTSEGNAYDQEDIEELDDIGSYSQNGGEDTIKVINVEDLEDLNKTFSGYKDKVSRIAQADTEDVAEMDIDIDMELYGDEESVSTSCDDMFSTDLDLKPSGSDGIVNDLSEMDMNHLSTTAFINKKEEKVEHIIEKGDHSPVIEHFNAMSILLSADDFKGYTVSQIRDFAVHNNIISKGDKKMKKKELVEHVIEANIKAGAEHLKVNKVGSEYVNPEEVDVVIDEKPDMTEIIQKASARAPVGDVEEISTEAGLVEDEVDLMVEELGLD